MSRSARSRLPTPEPWGAQALAVHAHARRCCRPGLAFHGVQQLLLIWLQRHTCGPAQAEAENNDADHDHDLHAPASDEGVFSLALQPARPGIDCMLSVAEGAVCACAWKMHDLDSTSASCCVRVASEPNGNLHLSRSHWGTACVMPPPGRLASHSTGQSRVQHVPS